MPPFHHVLRKMIDKCLVAAVVWRETSRPNNRYSHNINGWPEVFSDHRLDAYFIELPSPKRPIHPPEIRLIDDVLCEDEKMRNGRETIPHTIEKSEQIVRTRIPINTPLSLETYNPCPNRELWMASLEMPPSLFLPEL